MKLQKQCLFCNNDFLAESAEVKRGYGKYCSKLCSQKSQSLKPKKINQPNVVCSFCQVPFYKKKSDFKNSKSGLHFCCREHKDLAQRIGGLQQIQPSHYGTSKKIDYRSIAFEQKPKICEVCSYSTYPEILQVHHKDCNRENNTIENLQILCPNCHMTQHFLTKTGFWSS